MDIKIEKKDLLDGVSMASRAVSNTGPIPILNCIHLNALDNGIQLTGNNLELGIRTSVINAEIRQTGSIVLEAKMLSEIVKKLPDDYIQITVNKKNAVKIRSGKSEFNISGISADEFPVIPDVERLNKISIKGNIFRDMIRQTIFATSVDESRIVLTGELIKVEDGTINIVASDGFRIAYCYCEANDKHQSMETIIPQKTMSDVAKLLAVGDDSDIDIYFTESHVLFELGKCTVVSRLIDGNYLDFIKALNMESTTVVKVERNELLLALERACLIAFGDGKKQPVKLSIKGNTIAITSNTEIGSVNEEVEACIEGNGLDIAFNPRYLMDALKAIDDKEIAICFGGETSPCIIQPAEEGCYKHVVVPLKLK